MLGTLWGCLRFGVSGYSLWGRGLGVPAAWPALVTLGPPCAKECEGRVDRKCAARPDGVRLLALGDLG